MNCLQAQSKITAFIADSLDDDELNEFIQHIQSCPNCKEELEVYYTLIIGMRQLDHNESLSSNFSQELEDKLINNMERIRSKKRLVMQTKVGTCVLLLLICTFTLFKTAELFGIFTPRSSESERSHYYYMQMKPYLFTPKGSVLRNPYNYQPADTK